MLVTGQTPVLPYTLSSVNGDIYNLTEFDIANAFRNGRMAPGDSGGPVLRSPTELVGIEVGSLFSVDSPFQCSVYQDLTPAYVNWINNNTPLTNIPEPKTLTLSGLAGAALALRRRREKSESETWKPLNRVRLPKLDEKSFG